MSKNCKSTHVTVKQAPELGAVVLIYTMTKLWAKEPEMEFILGVHDLAAYATMIWLIIVALMATTDEYLRRAKGKRQGQVNQLRRRVRGNFFTSHRGCTSTLTVCQRIPCKGRWT